MARGTFHKSEVNSQHDKILIKQNLWVWLFYYSIIPGPVVVSTIPFHCSIPPNSDSQLKLLLQHKIIMYRYLFNCLQLWLSRGNLIKFAVCHHTISCFGCGQAQSVFNFQHSFNNIDLTSLRKMHIIPGSSSG